MKHRHYLLMIALAAVLVFVPSAAYAQDPLPEPPALPEPVEAPQTAGAAAQAPSLAFSGSATAGVSLESGRTDLNGIQLTFQGMKPYSRHGAVMMASTLSHATARPPGSADRITVANHLDAALGIEHNIGERWVVMLRSQAMRDPIARIDYRFEQIAGAGIRFGNRRVQARVVPGLAFIVHDKNIEAENGYNTNMGVYQDVTVSIAPGWTFAESLSTSRDVKDDDDYFFAVDARLTGAITRRLGLQVSYRYTYESLLPPGVEAWYQKSMVGLQLRF